jgi:cold shock CspA family protein
MDALPEISFRNMDSSPALEQSIRSGIDELGQFHPRIISCRVVVEKGFRRHRKGNLYGIHVVLRVPGREIIVAHDPETNHAHEDPYVAVRDALHAARRELEDHVRRDRGKVKQHEAPDIGRVSKLVAEADYGFIETDAGDDVYFHRNSVAGAGYDHLRVGDEVRFVSHPGEGAKGAQASTVTPIGKHHPVRGNRLG